MAKNKKIREYAQSDLNQFLKEQGTSSKDFAQYLDQTEVGICKKFKRGITQSLENDLVCFLLEQKGVKISIEGLVFKTIKA